MENMQQSTLFGTDLVPCVTAIRRKPVKAKHPTLPKPAAQPFGKQLNIVQDHIERIERTIAIKSAEQRREESRQQYNDSRTPIERMRELWRAVIVRAQKDALAVDTLLANDDGTEEGEEALTQRRALNWFIRNSKDFCDVCYNAEMDPDEVRWKSLRMFEHRGLIRRTPSGKFVLVPDALAGWQDDEEDADVMEAA